MLIVFCYVRDIELVARLLEDKGASTDGIDLRWMGYLEDA